MGITNGISRTNGIKYNEECFGLTLQYSNPKESRIKKWLIWYSEIPDALHVLVL